MAHHNRVQMEHIVSGMSNDALTMVTIRQSGPDAGTEAWAARYTWVVHPHQDPDAVYELVLSLRQKTRKLSMIEQAMSLLGYDRLQQEERNAYMNRFGFLSKIYTVRTETFIEA